MKFIPETHHMNRCLRFHFYFKICCAWISNWYYWKVI